MFFLLRNMPKEKEPSYEFLHLCTKSSLVSTTESDIDKFLSQTETLEQMQRILEQTNRTRKTGLDIALEANNERILNKVLQWINVNVEEQGGWDKNTEILKVIFPYVAAFSNEQLIKETLNKTEQCNETFDEHKEETIASKSTIMKIIIEKFCEGAHGQYQILLTTFKCAAKYPNILKSYMRDNGPFASANERFWDSVLSIIFDNISDIEPKIIKMEQEIDLSECRDEKEKNELLDAKRALIIESAFSCVILLLSMKNSLGCSAFDYEGLLPKHLKLFDLHEKYLIKIDRTLSQCFPDIGFEVKRSFRTTSNLHPLSVIGKTGLLELTQHPYIQLYINMMWMAFVRYMFYAHLFLYLLFFISLCLFVGTQQLYVTDQLANVTNNGQSNMTIPAKQLYQVYFKTSISAQWSEVFQILTGILAVLMLIFELMQLKTLRKYYFRQLENYPDIFISVGSLVVSFHSSRYGYNSDLHSLGLILILTTAIRVAWMVKHVPVIGDKFRLLLAVVIMVIRFTPVLLFFLATFAVIFHSLFRHQNPFSTVAYSMLKIFIMSIGEYEFEGVFFDDGNIPSLEIVTFGIFVTFLILMGISMTNLLIGYATGDFLKQLIDESDKWVFESKVSIIHQYCYMFQSRSGMYHNKKIKDLKIWHSIFPREWGMGMTAKFCLVCLFWPILLCCWCFMRDWDEDLYQSNWKKLKAKHSWIAGEGRRNKENVNLLTTDQMKIKMEEMKKVIDEMKNDQEIMKNKFEKLLAALQAGFIPKTVDNNANYPSTDFTVDTS